MTYSIVLSPRFISNFLQPPYSLLNEGGITFWNLERGKMGGSSLLWIAKLPPGEAAISSHLELKKFGLKDKAGYHLHISDTAV